MNEEWITRNIMNIYLFLLKISNKYSNNMYIICVKNNSVYLFYKNTVKKTCLKSAKYR